MRVVHCVSSIENMSAGTTYSVTQLSEGIARKGVEVELFSIGLNSNISKTSYIDVRYRNDFEGIPILSRLGASRSMSLALKNSKADVYHIHGLWMLPNYYPALAVGNNAIPLLLSPHGMLAPEALRFSPAKKFLAWHLWQKYAVNRVNVFRATCAEEYNEIRAFGLEQPVAIIPNGIEIPPRFSNTEKNVKNQVVSLGRIHPKKGLDQLIRAWKIVEESYPEWQLSIVGPDENGHRADLERLCFDQNLKRVYFYGPVFGAEKYQLLSNADVFVLPSLNENFAMTVAESLACETPVISTKGAPWAGLEVNGCGWWIDHGHESLAAALGEALSLSSEQRKRMGIRGREWMRRDFSWDTISEKMIEVYLWVFGQQSRPEYVID